MNDSLDNDSLVWMIVTATADSQYKMILSKDIRYYSDQWFFNFLHSTVYLVSEIIFYLSVLTKWRRKQKNFWRFFFSVLCEVTTFHLELFFFNVSYQAFKYINIYGKNSIIRSLLKNFSVVKCYKSLRLKKKFVHLVSKVHQTPPKEFYLFFSFYNIFSRKLHY